MHISIIASRVRGCYLIGFELDNYNKKMMICPCFGQRINPGKSRGVVELDNIGVPQPVCPVVVSDRTGGAPHMIKVMSDLLAGRIWAPKP